MNQITVNFVPCSPAPASGYNIQWRVYGSSDPYTDAGNFTDSPAIFTDGTNPDGTAYEGFIRSDLRESGESGENFCNNILWNTFVESGGSTYAIALVDECTGIFSNYLVSGGTIGDVVTVRATFAGVILKTENNFTRADVSINSPDGTSDSASSACYSDLLSHGFTINADTVITMTGATATVNLSAVTHNSTEDFTNVNVSIIDVNGTPHDISVIGCKGNSSTGGTC